MGQLVNILLYDIEVDVLTPISKHHLLYSISKLQCLLNRDTNLSNGEVALYLEIESTCVHRNRVVVYLRCFSNRIVIHNTKAPMM